MNLYPRTGYIMSTSEITIQKWRAVPLTATKRELHKKLVEFDRKCIRQRVNIRKVLTCTEPLQKIRKQLNERILTSKAESEVPLEKLSIHSDAFDEVIKASGVYYPLLRIIKESYDRYVLLQLKDEQIDSRIQLVVTPEQPFIESASLRQLKLRVSKLETHYKLAVEKNTRLKSVLLNEMQAHTKIMEDITVTQPCPDEQNDMLPADYSTMVESLQLQIANYQDALQEVMAKKMGKVPISVCQQLEQCLREVELEIQKLQKQSSTLEALIQEAETRFVTTVSAANVTPEISDKLWQGLQENLSLEI